MSASNGGAPQTHPLTDPQLRGDVSSMNSPPATFFDCLSQHTRSYTQLDARKICNSICDDHRGSDSTIDDMDLFFNGTISPTGNLPAAPSSDIVIPPVFQSAEAKVGSEDWTGLSDPKQRRKLQNRLNQRARRRKQKQRAENELTSSTRSANRQGGNNAVDADEIEDEVAVALGELELFTSHENSLAIRKRGISKPYLVQFNGIPSTSNTFKVLSEKVQQSYLAHSIGHPTHGHLTTIVHFNVFHGLARNAALLGMQNEWLIKGTTSSFVLPRASPLQDPSCPENMRPTALQRATPHHPWIDLWPLPRMRNNFLQASLQVRGTVDEDAICRDIVDVGAGEGIEKAALVLWGDAWDPRSWEATEGFLRKWGWLLEGCQELIDGTNYWRRRRGEKAFRFDYGKPCVPLR